METTMTKLGRMTRFILIAFAVVGFTVYLYPWRQRQPLQDILTIGLTEEDIRKYKSEKHHQYETETGDDSPGKKKKGILAIGVNSEGYIYSTKKEIKIINDLERHKLNKKQNFEEVAMDNTLSKRLEERRKMDNLPSKKNFTRRIQNIYRQTTVSANLKTKSEQLSKNTAVKINKTKTSRKLSDFEKKISSQFASNKPGNIHSLKSSRKQNFSPKKPLQNEGNYFHVNHLVNTPNKHRKQTLQSKSKQTLANILFSKSYQKKLKTYRNVVDKSKSHGNISTNKIARNNQTRSSTNHTAAKVSHGEGLSYDITMVVPSENSTYISNTLKSAAPFINIPPKSVNRKGMWQKVIDPFYEFYFFSAYFDDRPTLDNPAIRVISILEKPTPQLICILWYTKNRTAMLTIAEKMKIGVSYPHHNKKFDPSILTCQIPKHVQAPDYVSIVPAGFPLATTLLKVQFPEKVEDPFDFGACVSVSYWHHNPKRIVEWMELQRKWGLSEVTIYNDNMTDEGLKIFQYYAKQKFVDLRKITNVFDDNSEIDYWMNMSPSINDCMYRNMYRYKKIVCLDIDELIVPRMDSTYKTMLARYDRENPRTHPYKSYMFRNVYFFTDFGPVGNFTDLVTLNYLKRVQPSPFGYSVKCITDPMVCEGLQNHVCWHVVPRYKYFGWLAEVSPKIAMNQHYKKCHLDTLPNATTNACETAMAKGVIDATMLRFASDLQKTTDRMYKILQIK